MSYRTVICLFWKLTFSQLFRNSLNSMKPEGSLPVPHGPTIYPYPEPPIYPFMVRSSKCPSSSKFSNQKLLVLLPPPTVRAHNYPSPPCFC